MKAVDVNQRGNAKLVSDVVGNISQKIPGVVKKLKLRT